MFNGRGAGGFSCRSGVCSRLDNTGGFYQSQEGPSVLVSAMTELTAVVVFKLTRYNSYI